MSKLKCAYIYETLENPLPTRTEAEKKFRAKVLYGLGKHKTQKTPYAVKMYVVESAFRSVSKTFLNLPEKSCYKAELIAFDDNINELIFTLTASETTVTKFVVDDQVIDQMSTLDWKIGHLGRDLKALQSHVETLDWYRNEDVGDQQFFDNIPMQQKSLKAVIDEVERMLNVYKNQLKALFSSGWQ